MLDQEDWKLIIHYNHMKFLFLGKCEWNITGYLRLYLLIRQIKLLTELSTSFRHRNRYQE